MTSVASSVAAFIFSQLFLHWVTLFSANSRNAAGTSIFGISNFGISKRGISNLGISAPDLDFGLVGVVLISAMAFTFLLVDRAASSGIIKRPRPAACFDLERAPAAAVVPYDLRPNSRL